MKAGSVRTRVLSPQLALRSVAGNSRGLRPQESPRRCGVSPKARPASRASNAHCLVVYKVDRLSRSLLDFAGIMGVLEERGTSFVSITQQFNTTSSIGRLTLNVLLSFAQFERELISERTRDKMSAARRKGKWVGGIPPLGYEVATGGGRLVVNAEEAEVVREVFSRGERMSARIQAPGCDETVRWN